MTAYYGGKQKVGNRIATFLEENKIDTIEGYCEPFCGMLGVYKHIPKIYGNNITYLLGDKNENITHMWKQVINGWCPPITTTEEEYNKLKTSPMSALKTYIGHQYSFGGEFFSGYAPKYGKTLNSSYASKRVCSIGEILYDTNTLITTGDYTQYTHLENFIIYCDPPYKQTNINNWRKFDYDNFLEWVKYMSKNNIVYVSEYRIPEDFECIWEWEYKLTGFSNLKENRKRTDKIIQFKNNLLYNKNERTII